MLTERLQILVTAEQKQRLAEESARRGESIGSLIREAVDEHYRTRSREERMAAFARMRALADANPHRGPSPTPEEINRMVEEEREEGYDDLLR